MYNNIRYVIAGVIMALAVFVPVWLPTNALELSEPPTLNQILEAVKQYNKSVDKDLEITINFSHPDLPIVIPQYRLNGDTGAEIEQFVEQTHIQKEEVSGINGPGEPKNYVTEEEQIEAGGGGVNNDGEEWTQKKFDEKYGDSLPDDGSLDSD